MTNKSEAIQHLFGKTSRRSFEGQCKDRKMSELTRESKMKVLEKAVKENAWKQREGDDNFQSSTESSYIHCQQEAGP